VSVVIASNPPTRVCRPVAALLLACLLPIVPALVSAKGRVIENTAIVTYMEQGTSVLVTVPSNTVRIPVQEGTPTPATLRFLRYEGGADDAATIAVDGGACSDSSGTFMPIPAIVGLDGKIADWAATGATTAPSYYAGEPVVLALSDPNRNADPAVREFIEIQLSGSTGDTEALRLQETGVDTGVFAGAIQSVPVPPTAKKFDCRLSLADHSELVARYTDADFPIDALSASIHAYLAPPSSTILKLSQTVSRQFVEIGDFVQYTLVVTNPDDAPAFNVRIDDLLPPGLRYRDGSVRMQHHMVAGPQPASVDAVPAADAEAVEPGVSNGGRGLRFSVGDLPPGSAATVRFIAEIGAGARGPLLENDAVAGARGGLRSNDTDTVLRIKDSMLASRFTLVGNVIEGCGDEKHKGIAGVRLQLEDGTFVLTDANGAYHVEGLRPGTHVVQLDTASLPPSFEMAVCTTNTRFAGRSYSQFVEAQGGSLVRADFHLSRRKAERGAMGLRLQATADGGRLAYQLDVDGGKVPMSGLSAVFVLPDGASLVPGTTTVDGQQAPDPTLSGNIAVFRLGDPGTHWDRHVAFAVLPGAACAAGGYRATAFAVGHAAGGGARTPPTEVTIPCDLPSGPRSSQRAEVATLAADPAASSFPEGAADKSLDSATAAGIGVDWLGKATPGIGWMFPAEDYNPRTSITTVVVKYVPGQTVVLRANGKPVSPLRYDGKKSRGGVEIATWLGIPLAEGDTLIEAEIHDAGGAVVQTLSRKVHYTNSVARAEFVPEKSTLVADGNHPPRIAIRMFDASGHPARQGLYGEYSLSAPYLPLQAVQQMQQHQLAGNQQGARTWVVKGDDGIAYIELQPTTVGGSGTLGFDFGVRGRDEVHQDLQFWLKSAPRDWIVVGFASGSVGYETLKDNMQALDPEDEGNGVRADGQVSLYAKGRVLGSWLLTLAYDSAKPAGRLLGNSLLSTIDPGRYYTLYGDGTNQGYDASSSRKLYLKLERDQFYALFGDFQTGMDRTELSRYQRTLNGVKVEYRGALVEFNGFAARTSQNHARDEIPGDGTSGLYRLSHGGIVMNGEHVRIEVRDRFHSEQIVASHDLARHLDYDIDYDNGTLFFREPVASRDFDLNPVFIVVEYETFGTAEEYLNGGGRAGVQMMGGRLQAGVSYVRDEDGQGKGSVAGVDARFRPGAHDEVRAEAASTDGETGGKRRSGNAWLLEWEHRSQQYNLLAYARRNEGGFGLGQQNRSESSTFKVGMNGPLQLDEHFVLRGEAYRLDNLASGAVRDAAHAELAYGGTDWKASAGLQWARDTALDGTVAESRQTTLAASRYFFDQRLELNARADLSLGGKNESVDFPTRLQLGAAYRISEGFRVLAQQEFTDGKDRDTSTTRFGFEATPWANGRLTSTFNQSRITEYGPRTFALFGLSQRFQVGQRWGFDVAVDSSRAFNESGDEPLVVDPAQPIAAGGIRDGGALTEDFVALSGGADYHADLWTWNARLEGRQSDANDRYGITTGFVRQARDGVALSASMQAFLQQQADGSTGLLADAQLSWAYRPLGSDWSMLDKLEYHLDGVVGGTGKSLMGQDTIAANGDARSVRFVNNFVLNYASTAWAGEAADGTGSVFDLYQRSQLSLYYGSKYVLDSFDGDDYAGYTDILGVEARVDLTPRVDIGLRASVLHSWSQDTFAWAFGPSIGFTPFTNAWVSVGYNIHGFNDRDFESSHYTAEGAYLVFRMKFDQHTLGLDRAAAGGAP
jgi:uncharacterized repeat protein (TIGR01451 family)